MNVDRVPTVARDVASFVAQMSAHDLTGQSHKQRIDGTAISRMIRSHGHNSTFERK